MLSNKIKHKKEYSDKIAVILKKDPFFCFIHFREKKKKIETEKLIEDIFNQV